MRRVGRFIAQGDEVKTIPSLVLALALAGCAAAGEVEDTREARALERRLASRVAGEPRECVPRVQGQALTAADRRTIVYETPGEIWVSRLAADCPGLRPFSTLIVETHGDRYCRNDRIRALEPGTTIPGPICLLGRFTPHRLRR
jgi:hypothetical protein